MPRQTHTAGRRLRESKIVVLVEELLKRGARTKTVERLTGLTEVPIRDVYREMFDKSPQKGPSGYSHTHFTSTQVTQFHSSLAELCLEVVYQARTSPHEKPVAPELGYLYCAAYDQYLAHLEALTNWIQPMCFERFAHLALIMSKKSVLGHRKCGRCGGKFIAPTAPGVSNQRNCPACKITTQRGCSRCDAYVPLDSLDVSPKCRPMCEEHVSKYRPATFNFRQYVTNGSQAEAAAIGPVEGRADAESGESMAAALA